MQEMLEQMQKDVDEMRRSLKGRCQYLEARCGSLERTLQAVIKAQNEWEYPVAPVPTSHWTDLLVLTMTMLQQWKVSSIYYET